MIPNNDSTIYARFNHGDEWGEYKSRVIAWGDDGKAWCWGQYKLVPVSDLECFEELMHVSRDEARDGAGWQVDCAS